MISTLFINSISTLIQNKLNETINKKVKVEIPIF